MRGEETAWAARALTAARLAGACALGVIAQVAVHMPAGHFGAADRVTSVGVTYAAALGLVATLGALSAVGGPLRRRMAPHLTGWLAPAVFAGNVGLFLPAVVSDPLVAGLVVVWNAVLLAQHLFPVLGGGGGAGPALRHLAAVSLVLSVAVVGYRLTDRLLAHGICLALGYGTLAASWPVLRDLFRSGRRSVLVVAAPAAASLLAAVWLSSPWGPDGAWLVLSLLALAQAALLAVLWGREETTLEILRDFFDHPSRLIAVSFAGAILVGTVLLTFPAASAGAEPVAPLDALFTATSATCVTGLIVLDTPHDFAPFGQAVILALIQVGGLGIMTLSTFATVILGGRLGLRGERALTEMLDLQTAPTVYRLTRFIVLSTLAVEAVGAAGLAWCYGAAGLAPGAAVWRGVFHAVSAFCNAGFALQSDSLVMFREAPVPVLIHAVLITLGGLGFVVLAGVWNRLVRRERRPLAVQVRVVLAASGLLVAAGTVLYAACEWRGTLAGLVSRLPGIAEPQR